MWHWVIRMMVECKYCGAESSIPATDKVEDFELRYFKCNKCKQRLFPNGKLEEYKPKPLKTRATPAKPVPPKPKPETYKSSTDPMADKKIKGICQPQSRIINKSLFTFRE